MRIKLYLLEESLNSAREQHQEGIVIKKEEKITVSTLGFEKYRKI